MKTVAYILLAAGMSWTGTAKEEPVVLEDVHPVSRCLKASEYNYEVLLGVDDLLRYLAIDEASVSIKISPFRSENGWACYEWKSSRPDIEKQLWGGRIRMPDINRVSLKFLHFDSPKKKDLAGFQRFENLGDRSYWKWDRTHGVELIVEVGSARFTIELKVDATQKSDLEKAVYFARQVLTKCIP